MTLQFCAFSNNVDDPKIEDCLAFYRYSVLERIDTGTMYRMYGRGYALIMKTPKDLPVVLVTQVKAGHQI